MEFLDSKTTQVQFDNIHELFIAGIQTNKVELVQVNVYGAIDAIDEAVNNFYIFFFTSLPHTLQEDVESYGNQLASSGLVCNAIYIYPGRHK